MYQGIEPSKPSSRGTRRFTSSENVIGFVVNEPMIAFAILSYLSVAIVDDFFQPLPRMDIRESPLVFVLMITLYL